MKKKQNMKHTKFNKLFRISQNKMWCPGSGVVFDFIDS